MVYIVSLKIAVCQANAPEVITLEPWVHIESRLEIILQIRLRLGHEILSVIVGGSRKAQIVVIHEGEVWRIGVDFIVAGC